MKKKLTSKKFIAVILAMVMAFTSIPFMMVGAEIIPGSYDPAPKFSEDAQIEGADAWLDDEGNVQVTFPAADAEPTYKGEALSIEFYILELVDMGAKNAVHQKEILDTIKVTGTSATFKAADIGTIDLENKRYSVTVTAVDNENWFSLPLYTTVTDVPVAKIDPNQFANFSTSATAVREIMTFDQSDEDTSRVIGNELLYMGVADEAGTEDLTDNVGDTKALRFIMYNQPNGTQIFDTSMSRQTWDFKGAEEIWYWMDLSKVNLTGISFRLCPQEKTILGWGDGNINNVETKGDQYPEELVFSTKGTAASTYNGADPYVYVQRDDGGWNKVMLESDGTINLGNFKGYVRVPLEFMCSESDAVITVHNQKFDVATNKKNDLFAYIDAREPSAEQIAAATAQTHANIDAFFATPSLVVDPAGTPVTDALLLQRREYQIDKSYMRKTVFGTATAEGEKINKKLGLTPALQLSVGAKPIIGTHNDPFQLNDPKRAIFAQDGTLTNRENAYKAIEDIYSAGFAFDGCTADSLENSFFIDNIFFYRSDGGAYSPNSLNGEAGNTGSPMTTYYNQDLEIARIIFDEIDKRILDPDWADYRELKYILELIEEYKNLYISQGKDASFLNLSRSPDTTGMAGMATKLNRTATWEKAWLAYAACNAEGTIDTTQSEVQDWFISNGRKDDLVPSVVNTMEKLPKPESITSVSEALRKEIVKLWKAYSLLNLGQLEMLGEEQEKTLIKYFALVEGLQQTDGDDFVVGQRLADNPFIVFNDFENYELGEKAWQLEDNKDAYTTAVAGGTSNLANDWRHTKSLVTYTTNGNSTTKITDSDYYGYVTTDGDKTQEAMDGKLNYNASWATVTNDGYLHSKGVNLYSDSSFTASENAGVFHSITITKDGNPIGSDYSNNMSSENLGGLAQHFGSGDNSRSVPLALIFYVDFTQVENFYFTVNVFTRDGAGNHVKCRVDTGIINDADRKYWILDNETGEWEIIYTKSRWAFTSAGNKETAADQRVDYNKIDGYKGYLMIPLYHIKQKISDTSSKMLDEHADLLNNIFAIQFCIGGANPTDMDEKSIVIDNVGFSYSPDSYSAASSRNDKSYAEVFGAKSLPAKQFEDAVAAIDPYDEITLSERVQAAKAIYDTLPDVQKQFVEASFEKLELYTAYINNPSTIPQPYTTASDLVKWITDNLNSYATGATVTGDHDLTYPGFVTTVDADGKPQVVPNYAAYGLTAELAAQLKEFYNNSYIRYSVAEKQQVKDAGFLNAYNAAMRCLESLESIKTDALTFLPEITALYDVKYDYDDDGVLDDKDDSIVDGDNYKIGNFVSIAGRDEVQTFKTDKYDPLQYYSKTSIDDGSIYPQLQNVSRGFTYFLNNTRSYTVDGEEIKGGILNFRDKMQKIYDDACAKIYDDVVNKTMKENKERFTADELQEIKDILAEYNALLPAYYNVEELYELEQAIIRLFSVSDIAVMDSATNGSQLTTVELNNNDEASMKQTVYVDFSYIAAMLGQTVTLRAESDLKLTQTQGPTYASLNSFTATSLTADSEATLGVYDNLYPDETFSRIPIEVAVDPAVANRVPKDAVYEGKIIFNVYETAADIDAGLTDEDLVPIKTLELPIKFTSTKGAEPTTYEITFPAAVTVPFGETNAVTSGDITITHNMPSTKKLTISLSENGGTMVIDTTKLPSGVTVPDPLPSIDYTATFANKTFIGTGTSANEKTNFTVQVTEDQWKQAYVNDYIDSGLTFTVACEDVT